LNRAVISPISNSWRLTMRDPNSWFASAMWYQVPEKIGPPKSLTMYLGPALPSTALLGPQVSESKFEFT
jgi:hypothetical protein